MKSDLSHKHVCFLAPPFLSHLTPMLSLAQSLFSSGVKVTIGCSETFQSVIEMKGFNFTDIRINLNANKGSAADTMQMNSEKQRLDDFFEATRGGAVDTLSLQMRHRGKDMFANPGEVFQRIQEIDILIKPDIWVVDQLSYSVTVSLMALKLPFISFCPPHPASIPGEGRVYGIPLSWPEKLKPEPMKLEKLIRIAKKAESDFDQEVNIFLKSRGFHSIQIKRTFGLSSPLGIVFNYPDFKGKTDKKGPSKLYMGFSFLLESLPEEWEEILSYKKGKIIFLSLGTFLSARDDVLNLNPYKK